MIMFNAIEFEDGRSGRNATGEFPNACKEIVGKLSRILSRRQVEQKHSKLFSQSV